MTARDNRRLLGDRRGLQETARDHRRLTWIARDHRRLGETTKDYRTLAQTLKVCRGLVQTATDPIRSQETIKNITGTAIDRRRPCGTSRDCYGLQETDRHC